MASKPASAFRRRRTQVVAILGALVIVASLALPKLMRPGDAIADTPRKPRKQLAQEGTKLLRDQVREEQAERARAAARARASARAAAEPDGPAERVEVEQVARAGDDLQVSLRLRWESYPTGAAIRAKVEIANHDEAPVWIPAADEPQSTLAVRVLDESGVTVRHVVEESDDRMPRLMRRLGPGESTVVELDVLATGEEPLEPGSYELAAEFVADRAWLRTGLPVWTAPKGSRHSDRVRFEVTPR